jgi:hypothetical protein
MKLVPVVLAAFVAILLSGCSSQTLSADDASIKLIEASLCDDAEIVEKKFGSYLSCHVDEEGYPIFFAESKAAITSETVLANACEVPGAYVQRVLQGENWIAFFDHGTKAYASSVQKTLGGDFVEPVTKVCEKFRN